MNTASKKQKLSHFSVLANRNSGEQRATQKLGVSMTLDFNDQSNVIGIKMIRTGSDQSQIEHYYDVKWLHHGTIHCALDLESDSMCSALRENRHIHTDLESENPDLNLAERSIMNDFLDMTTDADLWAFDSQEDFADRFKKMGFDVERHYG